MLDAAAAQKMLDPLFPGLMDVRLMSVRLTALAPDRVAAAAPRSGRRRSATPTASAARW